MHETQELSPASQVAKIRKSCRVALKLAQKITRNPEKFRKPLRKKRIPVSEAHALVGGLLHILANLPDYLLDPIRESQSLEGYQEVFQRAEVELMLVRMTSLCWVVSHHALYGDNANSVSSIIARGLESECCTLCQAMSDNGSLRELLFERKQLYASCHGDPSRIGARFAQCCMSGYKEKRNGVSAMTQYMIPAETVDAQLTQIGALEANLVGSMTADYLRCFRIG